MTKAGLPSVLELPVFQPGTQGYTCTVQCGARCCKYYSLELSTPTSSGDFDDIRWYLMHENTHVYKYEGTWYLMVLSRCRHLAPGNTCDIYDRRPRICQDYDPSDCEFTGEVPYELYFKDDAELEAWLEKRKAERAEKRRAAKRSAAPPKGGKRRAGRGKR